MAVLTLTVAACAPGSGEPASTTPIVLEVDPVGVFVSTETVEGAWHAGFGVRCLLPPGGATHGQRLVGRVEGGEVVLVARTADGFDSLRPELRRVERSLVPELRAAAGRVELPDASHLVTRAFVAGTRSAREEPAPQEPPLPPRAEPAGPAEPPLPAGAPLASWAPPGALVVRFRSVEAGFRFADLADDLGQRLLFAAGEGGDHGTLRLTLHHLLLPSIWKANPNGRKGVAECALVVASPLEPGRLRAAVILRIVDPQLHDHETRAGVALESRPEHLWRPAGDPFPAERVRSAVRAVVGDCEVVATDRELLDAILAGPGRAPDESTDEAVAARHGLSEPDRRRAFTLSAPTGPVVVVGAAARRAERGARRLAEAWLGLAVPSAEDLPGELVPAPSPWADVVAVVADTDAKGASVAVRTRTPESATLLAARLRALPGEPSRLAQACRGNLAALVPLGIVEPRTSDVAERAFVWFGRRPVCPRGGAYRFHPMTGAPACSVHGDGAPGVAERTPLPPTPVSEVAVDGTLLTFRLSIDW